MIEVLNSFIDNVIMNIKPYVKKENKWYRARCNNCNKLIQRIHQELCKNCWVKSIQGQVRVVHNKPHTAESKRKISKSKQKEVLTYSGIHQWLFQKYPKKSICENLDCLGKSQYYDWACVTGKYERDISNFRRLCRSCHKLFDTHKIELRLQK